MGAVFSPHCNVCYACNFFPPDLVMSHRSGVGWGAEIQPLGLKLEKETCDRDNSPSLNSLFSQFSEYFHQLANSAWLKSLTDCYILKDAKFF